MSEQTADPRIVARRIRREIKEIGHLRAIAQADGSRLAKYAIEFIDQRKTTLEKMHAEVMEEIRNR